MGGCRCSYKNCQNSTKSTENVHFFHYPVKHKERCKIWIENADKPHFCDLEEDQLRNKVICEVHFEDKYFPNPQKKRLLLGAVPTLDGDYLENKIIEKGHLVVQDVQILPANDDGTIFVLETENMFNKVKRNREIESYVYKNGVIVPSSHAMDEPPSEKKFAIHTENDNALHQVLDSNKEIEVVTGVNLNLKKSISSTNAVSITPLSHLPKKVLNRSVERSQYYPQSHLDIENNQIMQEEIHIIDSKPIIEHVDIQEEGLVRKSVNNKLIVPKNALDKTVGRNYLRKIKQHSRDIASIKRMLKQKNMVEPDNTKILNALKGKIPSTLYTIVELNLNLKCNLTVNDIEFFNCIRNTSENVYGLLTDKYHWKLPNLQNMSNENIA